MKRRHLIKRGRAAFYGRLGQLFLSRGRLGSAEAMLRRALGLFERLGDQEQTFSSWGQLGMVHQSRGELGEAEAMFQKALNLARTIGDDKRVAGASLALASLYLQRAHEARDDSPALADDLDRGEAMCHQVQTLYQRLGNQAEEAVVWGMLGEISQKRGDWAEAEASFHRALALEESLGNKGMAAKAYSSLGEVHRAIGDLDKARDAHRKALKLVEEIRHYPSIVATRAALEDLGSEDEEPGPPDSPADDSPGERRSFSQLHRDVWRVVRRAPAVFVLLPIIVLFPLDVLFQATGGEPVEVFYVALVVGMVVVATFFLSALVEIGAGRPAKLWPALRRANSMFALTLNVSGAAVLRLAVFVIPAVWVARNYGSTAVVLVIPAVYFALRFALGLPVAAFEQKTGGTALGASAAYMRGGYWRLLSKLVLATLTYGALVLATGMLALAEALPWRAALYLAPSRILLSWITIGMTLVYADSRPDNSLAAPVGSRRTEDGLGAAGQLSSARSGVLWAVIASFAALAVVVALSRGPD